MENLSVIVVNYNSNLISIFKTFISIIKQKNINIEIVYCDDCSKNIYKKEIESFFEKNNFKNYKLQFNRENIGTVRNIIKGVEICSYENIKTISPGDLFSDDNICYNAINFLLNNKYSHVFVDLIAYSDSEQNIKTYKYSHPYIKTIYDKNSKFNKKIETYLIAFADNICGATFFSKKDDYLFLLYELKKVGVIYTEDLFTYYSVLLGQKIRFLPIIGILYEYGTGISTSGDNSFHIKIQNDRFKFLKFLNEKFQKNKHINFALKNKRDSLIKKVLFYLGHPLFSFFKIINKFLYRKPKVFDFSFYEECNKISKRLSDEMRNN